MITAKEYWDAIAFGGTYHPEVCARCNLNGSHLCTRNGCDITAQDAILALNGGKQPNPPKVRNEQA